MHQSLRSFGFIVGSATAGMALLIPVHVIDPTDMPLVMATNMGFALAFHWFQQRMNTS